MTAVLRSLSALGSSLRRPGTGKAVDERKPGDIACRNCAAEAPGAYCPACGQETALKLPTWREFMRDAAGRYVALDGRLWRTLAALLFRPGFLTREYLAGRRKRYVRPARLVLVLSLVLFAAFRLFADPEQLVVLPETPAMETATPAKTASEAAPPTSGTRDTAQRPGMTQSAVVSIEGEPLKIRSGAAGLEIDEGLNLRLTGIDSPIGERIAKRLENFNRLDRGEKARVVVAGMLRYGPYALVAMLPAFALLMQIVYLGRARRYPNRPRRYAEHLVYVAHEHAFVALVGTLVVVIPYSPASTVLLAWVAVYLLVSMRVVYGGRWIGVLARAFVVTIAYAVMFGFSVFGLLLAAIVLR